MRHRIKETVLPMLDTLGEALSQYLDAPSDALCADIVEFINAINVPLVGEIGDALELSMHLITALEHSVLDTIGDCYDRYCSAVRSIPGQYKVVFLPYYDNTWDSLESIYEAFVADQRFITEIVIIPIRRNTPTGWKMIYDDYLTPRGISNTPFSNYFFEIDLPDIVFYNNPYDGVNIEKFFSYRIKPYVGMMVYVPYFLYRHAWLSSEQKKKAIITYSGLPGHDSADLFIIHGDLFLKTFSKKSPNGKKMVVLGNPKTDKIYRSRNSYPTYPEWDKATKGKCVFFLNTHYTSAAAGWYVARLSYILKLIEEDEDLALIWRPHPQSFLMIEKEIHSERYMEWTGYLNRVNNHERMILDRTQSDISAIMYSNALISEESSVVSEAICADKPVYAIATDPAERIGESIWNSLTIDSYTEKIKPMKENNTRYLYWLSALHYITLEKPILKKEVTWENLFQVSLFHFMNEIKRGIDSKKEQRHIYCEQLLSNCDGSCGQKIHDYVAQRLIREGK